MFGYCILLLALPLAVFGIPIDNGVIGEPEIECSSNGISVTFNTQNTFEGHVYVKNRYDEPGCRSDEGGRNVATIRLPFSSCGTVRERSANPKGIFVSSTVVVSFHPNFLTKIDRAYKVQCFYMEADKTVSTDIEVSMITTLLATIQVPMPVCRYEILDAVDGEQVQFAIIGQPVIHQWTCDTDYDQDIFCMRVYSCFVDDGAGDRVDVIDEEGCALDKYILQNLEYPENLKAHKEAHVFKYADRSSLAFQCQIEILVKDPNTDCIRPTCADPSGSGDGSVARRQRRSAEESSVAIVDVRTQTMEPLETLSNQSANVIPTFPNIAEGLTERPSGDICMSTGGLTTAIAALMIVCTGVTVMLAIRLSRGSTKEQQFA